MAVDSRTITKLTENKTEKEHIFVDGDSNSQGLLPAPHCAWNFKMGIGENTKEPWPAVMERVLNTFGISVTIDNISECGRRLVGRTHDMTESLSLGAKDGRVALQQMVGTIFNKYGIKNERISIYINLGTNDLQDERISTEYLKGSMIKHLLTILTNPNLQYTLWKILKDTPNEPIISGFFENLTKFMAEDIKKSYFPIEPVARRPEPITEPEKHGEIFDKLLKENIEIIRELFSMISWNIVIIPPVLVKGRPFGAFPSAHLSRYWPSIVKEVVDSLNIRNIRSVPDAQEFSIPNCDEFGGSLHLTPEDHQDFGVRMAKDFIISKKNTTLEEIRNFLIQAIASNLESASFHTEIVGKEPVLLAFEASKKRQRTATGLIQEIAEYAIDPKFDNVSRLLSI